MKSNFRKLVENSLLEGNELGMTHHEMAHQLNVDGSKHSSSELSHQLEQHNIMKKAGYGHMRDNEGGITYHHPNRPFQVDLKGGHDAYDQILRHTNIASKVTKGNSNAEFNDVHSGKQVHGVHASSNLDRDNIESKVREHRISNGIHFS